VAREKAANFYHAFRLLPSCQFRAMCAIYTFLRITDDLADEPGEIEQKRQQLEEWRQQFDLALKGSHRHPLHPALADTVHTHGIPADYLRSAIDGVAMDFDICRYETFADLYLYCYRVASIVGLSCIHIWGYSSEEAKKPAEAAGIAFQLTNILRDIAEDAARGRVYLPREDLDRFGYSGEALARGEQGERFESLMRFEAERARAYYHAAEPLVPFLQPAGRSVFLVMLRTYRGLLERIVSSHFDVFRQRIRVTRWFKIWQVVRALPVRYGISSC
jgi:phytoene synthase